MTDQPAIVPPGTWRVTGGLAPDTEAFIPIVSPRSTTILQAIGDRFAEQESDDPEPHVFWPMGEAPRMCDVCEHDEDQSWHIDPPPSTRWSTPRPGQKPDRSRKKRGARRG
jgi:hypothetical protein